MSVDLAYSKNCGRGAESLHHGLDSYYK